MTRPKHITGSPGPRGKRPDDGDDAVPLLGLELSPTEKTEENSTQHADPDPSTCYAPLLGTISSHSVEIARGSFGERSPESVCYTERLHSLDPRSSGKSQKRAIVGSGGC